MEALGKVLRNFVIDRYRLQHPERAHLLELIDLPSSDTVRTSLSFMQSEMQRLQARFDEEYASDPDSPACSIARRALSEARNAHARQAELLSRCEQRDGIAKGRPAGCVCLGLGGFAATPPLSTFPGGLLATVTGPIEFEEWCSCPDGQQMAAERHFYYATAALQDAELARARVEQARSRALSRCGLTFKQAVYAIDSWGNLPSNRVAARAVREFSECGISVEGKPGLYLYGAPGVGKTALSAVAVRNWIEQPIEADQLVDGRLPAVQQALMLPVPDFLRRLKETFGRSSVLPTEAVSRDAYRPGLVVLDDLGAEYATPYALSVLFEIINHRNEHCSPTIITSNYPLDSLGARLGATGASESEAVLRVVSRLREMTTAVEITGEDLRS